MRTQLYRLLSIPILGLMLILLSVPLDSSAQPPVVGGCQLFPANNILNTPIDGLPVHPMSSTYISNMGGASHNLHPDFGSGVWPPGSNAPIGIPYITVDSTQPEVPISFYYPSESDPGPYPIPPDAPIEGGPDSTGDRHVIVVENDNCILYEVFDAHPQEDNSWDSGSGAVFDLASNDLHPDTWTSADAAGLPILPLLVRYDEVVAGEINHAIRITASCTHNSYVWPARHHAGFCNANYPPMGTRFRLRADYPVENYSPQMQVILRAMQIYGVIVADNGSNWFVSGAPDEGWDNTMLRELRDVQGGDFVAVDQSSLMVDYNSGATHPAPQIPTGMSVTGNLTTYPPSPVFNWTHDPNTTWYQLVVKDGGSTVLDQWYEVGVDIACNGTCAIEPAFSAFLSNGDYDWYVQPYNDAHGAPTLSARSDTEQFSVVVPDPEQPTGLNTIGSLVTAPVIPQFEWDHDGATAWYQVQINKGATSILNQWYDITSGDIACTTTCVITPNLELSNGDYQWFVTPWAEWSGTGTASNVANFEVNVPAASKPTGLTEVGSLTTPPVTPQFQWAHDGTASWYQLYVNASSGTVIDQWFDVSTLACGATCTVSPDVSLTNGNHIWWVRGWNSTHGNGEWSDEATFNVDVPAPTQPTGLTVIGDLNVNPVIPQFQWAHDGIAEWYQLYVAKGGTVVISQWFDVATLACGATCTASPNVLLANGDYMWWVLPWTSTHGNGTWSDGANFTVNVPPPPPAVLPSNLNVTGSLTVPANPILNWAHDSANTWYEVYVSSGATVFHNTWYQVGVDITCAGMCALDLLNDAGIALGAGTYQWWIRAYNPTGMTAWVQGADFNVIAP